ncbi:MAG: hypothetical protein WBD31_18180 [Rubripirellula sp.]
MTTLLFRYSSSTVPTAIVSRLRAITDLSISDVRSRVHDNATLVTITAFQNDWDEQRHLLVELSRGIDDGSLPLVVSEQFGSTESPVSPVMLKNLIQTFRGIEIDTQIEKALEAGDIDDPADFVDDSEDWTVR